LLEATGHLHADGSCTVSVPGAEVEVGAASADATLSEWLGFAVRAVHRRSDLALDYEMTFDPPNDDAEYFAIPAAPGTFLDLAVIHLVGAATLRGAAAAYPHLDWDTRRFRPNILVEGPSRPFAEDEWCGTAVEVGTAALFARQPTVRCAMPLCAQPGLDRQPALYEALDALHHNHLGIYLDVLRDGRVEIGDAVTRAAVAP
jgi:uncharacterized protein YcbX